MFFECSTPLGITASGTAIADGASSLVPSCSTPLGITASGTLAQLQRQRRAREVLNASRHHGERDFALRASSSTAKRQCSTPLGITASGTRPDSSRATELTACSTPLGITASGTPSRSARHAAALRAQRLSASRRAGPGARKSITTPATSCSTPLGITASGTSCRPEFEGFSRECSTPLGITASGTPDWSSPTIASGRAQRLSASRRAGPRPRGVRTQRVAVLNASRHHGERDQSACRR